MMQRIRFPQPTSRHKRPSSVITATSLLLMVTVFTTLFLWGSASSEGDDVLDNGNAVLYVLRQLPGDRAVTKIEVSKQVHLVGRTSDAWFDSICLYRPNVKCVSFDETQHRRPASEHTLRNMNTAAIYAYYRLSEGILPSTGPALRDALENTGLDPDDNNTRLDNPAGIGNVAAYNAIYRYRTDGMNALGDHPNSVRPGMPFSDYTGYAPVNLPTDYKFSNRWVPGIDFNEEQLTSRLQTVMTPQMSLLDTFGQGVHDIRRPEYAKRIFPPFTNSFFPARHSSISSSFFDMVDEVIRTQEVLTDEQKMTTELWDNKLFGPSRLVAHISGQGFPLVKFIDANFVMNNAGLDSFIFSWDAKRENDRVRPDAVIRHYYADDQMMGIKKLGRGLQSITGKEWQSYAYTDAHQEFPSGTTCYCYALTSAARGLIGNDTLPAPFQVPIPAGSSFREPGVTPQQDLTLGPFETLSEIAHVCGESRIWGGVHYRDSVEEAVEPCSQIGRLSMFYCIDLILI
eukprot:gb/GECH01010529.1/.p1 GENE.gb/GECH01010529.1/~~gb/GECH01010529.1/.p1  ORF type:complete len:513 (+),score=43.98 gb/GECH01010529.1/:1-1539(+)